MTLIQLATVLCRQWIGIATIALTVVASLVPVSFAQDSKVLDHDQYAGSGIPAEQRQAHDELSSGVSSETQAQTSVHIAEPVGRVRVGPEFVDGEPAYVRRTKIIAGMTIVEISRTPFTPVLANNQESSEGGASIGNPPDQPASW